MKKLISTRSTRSSTNDKSPFLKASESPKVSEAAISFDPEELTEEERRTWVKFCCELRQSREAGVLAQPFEIAEGLGLDLHHIEKVSMLPTAIWVAFLILNKDFLLEKKSKKYASIDEFLSKYPQFQEYDEPEKQRLFETANWMNIFFEYMPAKKNKGLIIQVIPKFLEGWQVKYVTGSGQTLRTRNRVTIYETEGDIKPYLRGKQQKTKKRSNTFTSSTSNEMDDNDIESDFSPPKRKKRRVSSAPRRVTTRPRKVLVKMQKFPDNEALDSTEEESIDIDSNSENESDFEDVVSGSSRNQAIAPLLQRICSIENCDMDTLMPLLQKTSSLESWNIDTLHPTLQRFASNESVAFEECLAYFRDQHDSVSSSNYDENSKNKQLSSLFDSAPVIDNKTYSVKISPAYKLSNNVVNITPICSVSSMDLQVPVVKRKSKKIIMKNNDPVSSRGKRSHDMKSSSFKIAVEMQLDISVNDANPENEFLIPPILLRDISWGPMNLAEPNKDITKMPAFPSPHSSYRPLDDLLFPFEAT